MKIVSTNVYVGPNIFAHFPVIRHVLDLGELEEWPTSRLGENFIEPLLENLPGLHEHGCSYREPGGFVRRLREDEGTWLGHVMEHVALELQNVAGSNVTYGRTRSIDGKPGHYNMVFQYKDAEVGKEASPPCVATPAQPFAGADQAGKSPGCVVGFCYRTRRVYSLRATSCIRAEYCVTCGGRRGT